MTLPRWKTGKPRRTGFTLVELAVVLLLVGVLAAIAVPRMRSATTSARAAAVMTDMRTVRTALFEYFFEHNAWPAQAAPGEVPAGLTRYLPENFSFRRPYAEIRYELSGEPATGLWGRQVGLTARIEGDPGLQRALAALLAQMGPEPGDDAVVLGVWMEGAGPG